MTELEKLKQIFQGTEEEIEELRSRIKYLEERIDILILNEKVAVKEKLTESTDTP